VLFGLMLDVGGRKMKRRQEIEKCVEPETRQRLEDNWLAGNSFECQQLDPPPFLEPERHHTTADLFPIKSITRLLHDSLVENRPADLQQVAHCVTPIHNSGRDAGNDRGMAQHGMVQTRCRSAPCQSL